jgi:wyosine [tRNA(Phe)-imidazoG37] synthetase (radical SAM superfamily)
VSQGRSERYVYGPVPSRRLGQSLGVDPIPFKTCNYNCVYCQLGRTRPLTNGRRDYIPAQAIAAQLDAALTRLAADALDYITFVGQGEPTLCASLGFLIEHAKRATTTPVAVITNGALCIDPQVRRELAMADTVIPTLDAAEQTMFKRVNRPWPGLRVDEIIEGLAAFRGEFHGQLWMEVMLVKGLNDDEAGLLKLRDALANIAPDRVQINLPVRPPAESWVEIPDDRAVARATAILGEAAEVVLPYEGEFDLSNGADPAEAVLTIIRRHPMRERRLLETLAGRPTSEVEAVMLKLEESDQARRRVYRGQAFWEYAGVRSSS